MGWTKQDTHSDEGPQCPHCGFQYTADDPLYYDEMGYTSDTCCECGKDFEVEVSISIAWNCSTGEKT